MKKLILCAVVVGILLHMISNSNNNSYMSYKQPTSYISYTIKKGECLSLIAERYKPQYENISNFVNEIIFLNNKANEVVNIGDIIKVPVYK